MVSHCELPNGTTRDIIPASVHVRDRKIVYELELATIPSHGFLSLRLAQLPRSLLRHQNEIIHQESSPDFHPVLLGLLCVIDLLHFHDQRVLDAEHCVGSLVWIVFEVESTVCVNWSASGYIKVCDDAVSTHVIKGSYPSFLNMKCI